MYLLEQNIIKYFYEQAIGLPTISYFEIEPSITRMKMGSDRGGAQIDPEGEGMGQVLACKIVFIYCNLQAALFFMLDML